MINPHDIHGALAAVDGFIFGVRLCVWAEKFASPPLTELMQFFYLNFVWLGMASLLLLIQASRLRVPHGDRGRRPLLLPGLRGLPRLSRLASRASRSRLSSHGPSWSRGTRSPASSAGCSPCCPSTAEAPPVSSRRRLSPTGHLRLVIPPVLIFRPRAVRGRALDLEGLSAPPLRDRSHRRLDPRTRRPGPRPATRPAGGGRLPRWVRVFTGMARNGRAAGRCTSLERTARTTGGVPLPPWRHGDVLRSETIMFMSGGSSWTSRSPVCYAIRAACWNFGGDGAGRGMVDPRPPLGSDYVGALAIEGRRPG